MNVQVKEMDGKLICTKYDHNEPISMVIMENTMPIQDRLLCAKCFQLNRVVVRIIGLDQVKEMINDKLGQQVKNRQETKENNTAILKQFQQKMKLIQTQINKFIDETLRISEQWINQYEKVDQDNKLNNLIKGLEILDQQDFNHNKDDDQIIKTNKSYFVKLSSLFKQTEQIMAFQNCYDILKQVVNTEQVQENISQNVSQIQLINSVKQEEDCYAITFNMNRSIMVAGCQQDIKIFKFDEGQIIEQKRLTGHSDLVLCLVFSKKINWFASGSDDQTIICWKQEVNGEWLSNRIEPQHTCWIGCLLLTKNEDELISSSGDQTIKVWNVNCLTNKIGFKFQLEYKHNDYIWSISVNESETQLVSCSQDKSIILWNKGQDNKWQYQNEILTDDYGFRVCFISEQMITWQQESKGITHIFEIVNGELIRKPELNIQLDQESVDLTLFPTIYNKRRDLIVQKHNKYVYLLKKQENGQLKLIADPIDCLHWKNIGTLTDNGEYLAVYNEGSKEFRVHRIMYQ